MVLKIMGFIYRYTGIYLAQRYEDRYIWDNLDRFALQFADGDFDGMTFSDYVGLQRGLWQVRYGFYRPFSL